MHKILLDHLLFILILPFKLFYFLEQCGSNITWRLTKNTHTIKEKILPRTSATLKTLLKSTLTRSALSSNKKRNLPLKSPTMTKYPNILP